MGADSSTLQSIESLNSTLEDIEKKLFVIEDVHLHHERTIAHDDSVLISGKKISCRSGVRLLCGPILGTIGSSFARLLVEVDCDSDLTLNVFVSDARLMCSRYSCSITLAARKNVPIATKITHLLPGTNYCVYIGGITPAECVTSYASFQTLPNEARAVRILLTNNGRVDRLLPGESNLWREIESRVVSQSTAPGYVSSDHTEEEDTSTLYLPLSNSSAGNVYYQSVPSANNDFILKCRNYKKIFNQYVYFESRQQAIHPSSAPSLPPRQPHLGGAHYQGQGRRAAGPADPRRLQLRGLGFYSGANRAASQVRILS